jgi:hypothetical protein
MFFSSSDARLMCLPGSVNYTLPVPVIMYICTDHGIESNKNLVNHDKNVRFRESVAVDGSKRYAAGYSCCVTSYQKSTPATTEPQPPWTPQFIIYAQFGTGVEDSKTGIWWYGTKDAALYALDMVMAVCKVAQDVGRIPSTFNFKKGRKSNVGISGTTI